MDIATLASIEVPRPIEQVFDFSCSCDTYERLFRKRGMVAGISKAEIQGGKPLAQGVRRRITLGDGGIVEEDVVTFDRPNRHTYRWTGGLRGIARLLVKSGQGDWVFTPSAAGTRIDWTYTFALTTPVVYPLAAVMRAQFRAWMEQQLAAIAGALAA